MGPSRADEQLITTSLIAHGSGSFPGACSKWSEASDSRQTLPNAVRGASQRVCGKHSSEVTAEAQNTYACSIHTHTHRHLKMYEQMIRVSRGFRFIKKHRHIHASTSRETFKHNLTQQKLFVKGLTVSDCLGAN